MNHSWRLLRTRLFVAHLVVIVCGALVFGLTALLATPRILDIEVAHFRHMMDTGFSPAGMPGTGPAAMAAMIDSSLSESYRSAIVTALLAGGSAALVAATAVSAVVAGRMAEPLQSLAGAAQRIAGGRYDQSVPETGVTELASLARSYNEMASALSATEQRRRSLIADVAHELRTPVATLAGYLEGLDDGVVPANSATWTLLQAETRRLGRIVADLNDLSRAEAHQYDLDFADIEAAELVRQAYSAIEGEAIAAGLSITCEPPPTTLRVRADRERALQVLLNVLGNAVRYTPAPGSIRLAYQATADQIGLVVRDSGLGIAADELGRVFERFYRVDKSRSRALGGSGIGLTIARALAESMGGGVTAESPGRGHGSTFTFWLPRAAAEPGEHTDTP